MKGGLQNTIDLSFTSQLRGSLYMYARRGAYMCVLYIVLCTLLPCAPQAQICGFRGSEEPSIACGALYVVESSCFCKTNRTDMDLSAAWGCMALICSERTALPSVCLIGSDIWDCLVLHATALHV